MRIIAGRFKGRRLKSPPDRRVRLTTERVREAWFSILAPSLEGSRVLDLFAGSGVLGLEALSRGATSADFVEVSRTSVRTINTNVATLRVEAITQVNRGDALRFTAGLEQHAYDIAFADPPFSTGQAFELQATFRNRAFCRVLVIEHRSSLEMSGGETRLYGDIALTFLYES